MTSDPAVSSDDPGAEDRRHLFEARDLALGGLFGALGILIPIVFHAAGPGLGSIFLPMYLPILALGLLVSWEVALIVGCATPLLSAALTGMPPLSPPIAIIMLFELVALGTVASLARSRGAGIWLALVLAIIASRIVGVLAVATIGHALGYEKTLYAAAILSLGVAWPGILLQLTVVPGAVYAIEKTSIIGPRWKKA